MTHFTGVIWVVLARGAQKGVQKGVKNRSKTTPKQLFLGHFGVPLFDPFGRSGPKVTHFTGVIWTLLARGVQKGVQKRVILDPLGAPPGAQMTGFGPLLDPS